MDITKRNIIIQSYDTGLSTYLFQISPHYMGNSLIIEIPGLVSNCSSAVDYLKCIFVNYHIAFGDYSRIKICKWCKKLFVEIRKGRKEFCGDICKKRDNYAKRQCIARQNNWMGNRDEFNMDEFLEFESIKKIDCGTCDMYKDKNKSPAGKCPLIEQKNPEAYKEYIKSRG